MATPRARLPFPPMSRNARAICRLPVARGLDPDVGAFSAAKKPPTCAGAQVGRDAVSSRRNLSCRCHLIHLRTLNGSQGVVGLHPQGISALCSQSIQSWHSHEPCGQYAVVAPYATSSKPLGQGAGSGTPDWSILFASSAESMGEPVGLG
jgi:hypothetical protein